MSYCSLTPVEYNVIVEPDATETVTPGGIILPTSATERDELSTDEGVLVAVSQHAFSYAVWAKGTKPPAVGDRVVFAKYAGTIRKEGDATFRIIKDQSIVAVIQEKKNV